MEDIKNKFTQAYGERGRTAMAYSMNEDFSRVLSKQMDHYSSSGDVDKIERVKADMDDVKNVMVDNIEKVGTLSALLSVSPFPSKQTYSSCSSTIKYIANKRRHLGPNEPPIWLGDRFFRAARLTCLSYIRFLRF